ncbi:MAG: shikimate kinase [Pseudomonadota bacterium]
MIDACLAHHLAIAGPRGVRDRTLALFRAALAALGLPGSCRRALGDDPRALLALAADLGFTGVALCGALAEAAPAAPLVAAVAHEGQVPAAFARLTGYAPPPGVSPLPPVAPPPRRVALSGFAGSGKSTVGRLLAERLGWAFVDTDTLITAETGRTPAHHIRARGEAAFRALEREVLGQALEAERAILALGGGAVTQAPNRAALAGAATVVTLWCPLEVCLARVDAASRPLLATGAEALFAARRALYRDSSDLLVSGRPPPAHTAALLAAEISGWWEEGP